MAAGCVIAKRRNLISKAVLGTVILVLMLLMLLKPDEYIKAAADGIKLFCVSVLPAMFPFVFFSQILILCGMQESFSKPFTRPVKFLFNSPPEGAFIMVMSFISGYPIGAKLCADLYNKGVLSKEDVKNIIP
ncbi:MAG: hypothetical protein LBN25_03390, partial [Christensenellaceae bacterium]|nr:hypothetical protein [Christensenellaceae bacterium]